MGSVTYKVQGAVEAEDRVRLLPPRAVLAEERVLKFSRVFQMEVSAGGVGVGKSGRKQTLAV